MHLVKLLARFDKGLVKASSTCHHSYHCSAMRMEPFHFATGQLHDSFLHVVRDKHPVDPGCSRKTTSVARLRFDTADRHPFRDFGKRQNIASFDLC
jgi:hypothetical protein